MTFLLLIFSTLAWAGCPADMAEVQGACIDRYEAPNLAGAKPLIARTAIEGEAWCAARGKRLCGEEEWVRACRGAAWNKYPYGKRYQQGACNDSKEWISPVWSKVAKGWDDPVGRAEIERLDQSEPSGSRTECGTEEGVFDLAGNAAEWVKANPGRPHGHAMKGCYWAGCFGGTRPNCEFINPAHPGNFRSYESGFRCCLSLSR